MIKPICTKTRPHDGHRKSTERAMFRAACCVLSALGIFVLSQSALTATTLCFAQENTATVPSSSKDNAATPAAATQNMQTEQSGGKNAPADQAPSASQTLPDKKGADEKGASGTPVTSGGQAPSDGKSSPPQPAGTGNSTATPAALGASDAPNATNASGEPAAPGTPEISGNPAASNPPAVSGEPGVSGEPTAPSAPTASGNPAISGEPGENGSADGSNHSPAQKSVADTLFDSMSDKAKSLSASVFEKTDGQVPDFLLRLGMDQWQNIRFKPEAQLWSGPGANFTAELYHPGAVYTRTAAFYTVENGELSRVTLSPDMFDYPSGISQDQLKNLPSDFAGFRLIKKSAPGKAQCAASFLGATFFQSAGKHADLGPAARGLSVNTAAPNGEEFPYFREFWLVKPAPEDTTFTLYALLDSPSLTGAYEFTINPGTALVMNVRSKLFPRNNAWQNLKIGIAPLNSMYFYSETTGANEDDYRPEVHSSDGLLYSAGGNNWFWRPLNNPERLSVQAVPMQAPEGFGLLQRDIDFDHYQDIDARFEKRASVWVEPREGWGNGNLELIEIPTKSDMHNNIYASWLPDMPNASDGHAKELSFAYTMYWMNPGVTPHSLGKASDTRLVRSPEDGTARFVIDFTGPTIESLPADTGLSSVVETPENAPLIDKQLSKNPATGGWRLDFTVRLPQSSSVVQNLIKAGQAPPPLLFKALLKKGDNLPDPLTETWVYPLHQK